MGSRLPDHGGHISMIMRVISPWSWGLVPLLMGLSLPDHGVNFPGSWSYVSLSMGSPPPDHGVSSFWSRGLVSLIMGTICPWSWGSFLPDHEGHFPLIMEIISPWSWGSPLLDHGVTSPLSWGDMNSSCIPVIPTTYCLKTFKKMSFLWLLWVKSW